MDHFICFKLWADVVPVALAIVCPERKELGLEVSLKWAT